MTGACAPHAGCHGGSLTNTSATRFAAAVAFALALPVAAPAAPSCAYGPGDLPAVTLPPGTPHGAQIPAVLKSMWNPNPLGGAPIEPFRQMKLCEVAQHKRRTQQCDALHP